MVSENDLYIIKKLFEGEDSVLEIVYRRYYQPIAHFIFTNNGSEQEAKDIYQETIIIFYEKVMEGNFELTCSLKTFLYSISRKLWLQKLQKKKKFVSKIEETEEFVHFEDLQSDEALEKELDFERMESSMALLGEPCKSLLEDFYIFNLSMTEIADKFGYTNADNAKNQKYKCLNRLKKYFFNKE